MYDKPKIMDEICTRLSRGEALRKICRDEHMPNWSVVYDWMHADEQYAQRIARARDVGHDAIAENAMEIADEAPPSGADGKTDSGYVAWQKNRVWTRLQLLAKWNPKKYGDRQDINLTGKLEVADAIVAARKRAGQNTP